MYLNCKTNLSFRYGTFRTKELVDEASALGVTTLAITNINNTCDLWDFTDYCRQAGIKPVAGTEIRNDNVFQYILLAKNDYGIEEINRFLSIHLQQKLPFPARPVSLKEVFVIYAFGTMDPQLLEDHERIGVQLTETNKLFNLNVAAHRGKFVIRHPVTFRDKSMYNTHRLLRAIDRNIILSKQLRSDIANANETFLKPQEITDHFRNYPTLLHDTFTLLDQCSVSLVLSTDKTKKVFSSSRQEDRELLERLAMEGLQSRYGTGNEVARQRLHRELRIIDELGFNAYFLITRDMIRYARARQYYYVGRGSGANSIVAYCLGITDVDPVELDLYFERFLNVQRKVPPDFDIDFSWRDRDDVIAYLFGRYGTEHVALLGSFNTFQNKAILRELGKVFGLPKEEIDALEHGSLREDGIQQKILHYSGLMKDFPNHLSIHAGGILISEETVFRYSATELPAKGFPATQIDMHVAEKVGLYKLDVLSQRGLGHIRETIELVQKNRNEQIDITQIAKFKKDPVIASKIRKADTIGCFYIESPAMRQLLQKLECDDYLTLVAASSIIRPGVAQSGMMKQYIQRYHHPGEFQYLHPKMEELLKETYGVMVYQEDVIKVAHHFAGLDLADADTLRRAMSGKYRGREEFEGVRNKFFSNCKRLGYDESVTQEVWRQIESFGGYSFSKAHSASFAVESYQSLFLKTYYPLEFMVAVINNFGGFYSREVYFQQLRKMGARAHAPCVNASGRMTSLCDNEVHMGFVHLKDLEETLLTSILSERAHGGAFVSLADFIGRVQPALVQLNLLIRAGAFRFTGKQKKELLWEANFLQKRQPPQKGRVLFATVPTQPTLPALITHPLDDALDQIELFEFALCNPFELVDEDPETYLRAAVLPDARRHEVSLLGYLIATKTVRTAQNGVMYFGTFIDVAGDWIDTVHFPDSLARYPLTGKGFYKIQGRVVEDFGVCTVEVKSCIKAGLKDRKAQPNTVASSAPAQLSARPV